MYVTSTIFTKSCAGHIIGFFQAYHGPTAHGEKATSHVTCSANPFRLSFPQNYYLK